MTLVIDRGRDGPRIHVLVIGVGLYRHLPGGEEPVPGGVLNLKQITSPPVSALQMAEWLANSLNHPEASFGTLEMLLSPAQPVSLNDDPPKEVSVPNRQEVTRAFRAWKERCNTNERNVAIFYFCGHGVEKESQYLLLEDFGATADDLLENALDIRVAYDGMSRCRSKFQYFFIDACREIPFLLLKQLDGGPLKLIVPTDEGERRLNSMLLIATPFGRRAFGKQGEVSRFTGALLDALKGSGARQINGRWKVGCAGLHAAMSGHLRSDDPYVFMAPEMRLIGQDPMHVCSSPPTVPVTIECDPDAANEYANFALVSSQGAVSPWVRPKAAGKWNLVVPADVYTLSVEFSGGEYRQLEQPIVIWPPPPSEHKVVVL
ncbi:caspase family protein [Streptomyces sp. NPDC091273]|uniref:caspase family protein n=1 Tax=Streptomyces sp. NPDC091273 TaxID=3365982 RepID=UPI00382B1B33